MEYQKVIHLIENTSREPSNFKTKIVLKSMMNQKEHTILNVKSNLKLQC